MSWEPEPDCPTCQHPQFRHGTDRLPFSPDWCASRCLDCLLLAERAEQVP